MCGRESTVEIEGYNRGYFILDDNGKMVSFYAFKDQAEKRANRLISVDRKYDVLYIAEVIERIRPAK